MIEAGFTPSEAVKVMTANGAQVLGITAARGTITTGKAADLVVIRGDPSVTASDIRRVAIVFRDGVGYDAAKLIASVAGQVGSR